MRIAIDIDSTLHHYWDELAGSAKRRFGVDLPYEHQHTWKISRLRDEQLRACIADTHSAAVIARARPYPHAVEIVNAWHQAGHWIHVTSHRADACHAATDEWLTAIGLQYDDLHCSHDKLGRCVELEIDLLIDDSPITLMHALDSGIVAATLLHPWNRDLCEEEVEVVSAQDWPSLAEALELRLPRLRRAAA
jgi:uncharacterized protein